MGFAGTFPRYRRATDDQVEIVEIVVRGRTGLQVELSSLPPGSKAGTWRSEKLRKKVLDVRSGTDTSTLPRKLATAARSFRRAALAFWRESQGHWSSDARSTRADDQRVLAAVARALLDGNAAKLAAAASRLDASTFARGLAGDFPWNDDAVNRKIWKCAAVLIRHDPPKAIAASLLTSAVELLCEGAKVPTRTLAKQVLAWGKPRMRRDESLARQVIHVGNNRAYRGQCARAAALFEYVLDCSGDGQHGEWTAVATASAVFSVLSANRPTPPARPLQERVLSLATTSFPKDRFVRLNAACLSAELGDAESSVEHLLAALKLRIDPKAVITQPGLETARSDARVARALRGVRAPTKRAASSAGLLPP